VRIGSSSPACEATSVSPRPIHVVVVAYHGAGDLDRCLVSLGSGADVTIVDNSASGEVRAVAERHRFDYCDAGGNLGFGAGANIVLRRVVAGAPCDVLLLNPDVVLGSGAVGVLADHLARKGNERVAAVSPRLTGVDGAAQRVSWPFPSPARAWCEAIGLGLLPARRSFSVAAVLLLRWEAIQRVGLFDERFFLYAEEADWQRRALDAGWTSAMCDEAVAEHVGAGTSENPLRREALFHAGQETYIRKWHGPWGWNLYRAATCLGACGRALVLVGDRRREAARRMELYARGPRRVAASTLGKD
jgi:GT2 family glycosyltransferase